MERQPHPGHVRVFGSPVIIRTDTECNELRGRPAAVLSLLASRMRKTVHIDEITRIVWGSRSDPPDRHTVESTISAIRSKGLSEDVLPRGDSGLYRLDPGALSFDCEEFDRLARQGSGELKDRDYAAARRSLSEALDHWGEGPLFLRQEWASAENRQRCAVLDLAEALVALGEGDEAIDVLRSYLNGHHPNEIRPWELLIGALDRADKLAEALRACQEGSAALAERFGTVPQLVKRQRELRARIEQTMADPPLATPTPPPAGAEHAIAKAAPAVDSTGPVRPDPRWRRLRPALLAIAMVLVALLLWPYAQGDEGGRPRVTSAHEVVPQAIGAHDVLWGSRVTKPDRYATPGECLRPGHVRGLVLAYDMVPGSEGGWVVTWPTPLDASSFTDLVLWVKADRPARTFAVGVKDQRHEEKIETSGHIAVGREWTEWRLPLAWFGPVNMGAVSNVNIGFNIGDGAGRLCVGSIAFVS